MARGEIDGTLDGRWMKVEQIDRRRNTVLVHAKDLDAEELKE